MNKPKITVMGSFVVDLMSRTPYLPSPGETVLGGPFKLGPGGKGSNQAVAAARAGADVTLITKLGDDEFAKIALDNFKKEGINTRFVYKDKRYETGTALIMVDNKTAENMIVVAIGACNHITIEDINKAEDAIATSKILLTQLETNIEAVINVLDLAEKHNVKVILNPAPARQIPEKILSKVNVLTPNETEAEKMTGIKINTINEAERAGKMLLNKGVRYVVITLGRNGALLVGHQVVKHISSIKVNAIDTTGAGDAFNGGLATALAEGKNIEEAVEFANYTAAISVTKVGTAPSMPYRKQIDEFAEKFRSRIAFFDSLRA